jgi:hypothetical protein
VPTAPHSRRSIAGATLLALATGCGSSDTPLFGPTPNDQNGSLSGTLVEYGTGQPVASATLIMSGMATVADAQGRFRFSGIPASGTAGLTTDVNGFLFRGVALQLAPMRTGVTVDLIRNAPPFDLPFYRQLVRNGWESPVLAETRRWTIDPSFYLRSVTSDTAEVVPADLIESIRVLFERSIPELSGGTRRLGAFEVGTEPREVSEGWVIVDFMEQPPNGVFGQASVGGNSGTMTLRYPIAVSNANTNPFNCSTPTLGVADHEITHTMGYWHTANVFEDTFSGEGCPGAPRPAHTKYHAGILYSRAPGNRDPDVDAVTAIQSQVGAGRGARIGPIVACRLESMR